MSDLCRRCTHALPPPPRFEAVNSSALAARTRASGPALFPGERSLSREDSQLRGKTERELTIGRRLRELREQRHLTQQEMAGKAGVPRTYISRIENARLLPGPLMLGRIADALAVAILDLLPDGKNGVHASDSHDDPFLSSLVQYFSQLSPEEMSVVLAHVREMVSEGQAASFQPVWAAN